MAVFLANLSAKRKALTWVFALSMCASSMVHALAIEAANVGLGFVSTQDQGAVTGCGFKLSVFDPVNSLQLFHTFMIQAQVYQATTSVTYIDIKTHMNGGGSGEDKPLKVYNAWLLENTAVQADSLNVKDPKSVLTYNVKSYFDGKAIGTTAAQYTGRFTDNDLDLVQTSVDPRVFYAELYLVLSGNFQFIVNIGPQQANTVLAINVPTNRPVYDQIRHCVASTSWFKTSAFDKN